MGRKIAYRYICDWTLIPTHLMLQDNGSTEQELLIISLLNLEMQPQIESLISGRCNVTIAVNGRKYQKFRLDVVRNLCSDVILGHEF